MRRNIRFALPLAVAISIVGTTVHAGTPVKVIDTTGYEFGSASGEGWIAWSKGVSYGGDHDLYVKQTGQPADVVEAGKYQQAGNIEIAGPNDDILVFHIDPGSEMRRSASTTSRPSSSVLLPPGSTPRRTTTSRRSPGTTCCSAADRATARSRTVFSSTTSR